MSIPRHLWAHAHSRAWSQILSLIFLSMRGIWSTQPRWMISLPLQISSIMLNLSLRASPFWHIFTLKPLEKDEPDKKLLRFFQTSYLYCIFKLLDFYSFLFLSPLSMPHSANFCPDTYWTTTLLAFTSKSTLHAYMRTSVPWMVSIKRSEVYDVPFDEYHPRAALEPIRCRLRLYSLRYGMARSKVLPHLTCCQRYPDRSI